MWSENENIMKNTVFYRAMPESEFSGTIGSQKPSWNKRFKLFSDNLDFVLDRVRDGRFNNSKFSPDRYAIVVEFSVDGADHFRKCGNNEFVLDRRSSNQVKFNSIKRIL